MKLGSVVRVTDGDWAVGEEGILVRKNFMCWGVDFKKNGNERHTLDGILKNNTGLWILKKNLVYVSEGKEFSSYEDMIV